MAEYPYGPYFYREADTSYPPGVSPTPATGGPSMPPNAPVPQHQTAEPYIPGPYQEQIQSYHPAVQQAASEMERSGANPQEIYQKAQQMQMQVLQRQQQGQQVENVFQANADDVNRNPVAEILETYDQGFVPFSRVQKAASMLS